MFTNTANPNLFIRNYAIAALIVICASLGLSDMHRSPNRVAQQQRIDGYSRVITAGIVQQAKNLQYR